MKNSLSQAVHADPTLVDFIKPKEREEKQRLAVDVRPIQIGLPEHSFPPEPASVATKFIVYQKGNERHYHHNDEREKLAFRADATHIRPEGKVDQRALGAMVEVAQSRGWSEIQINGNKDFAKAAWIEIEARGARSRGYEPTREDMAAAVARKREIAAERAPQQNAPQRMSEGGQRLFEEISKVIDQKIPSPENRETLKRETEKLIVQRESGGRVIDFPERDRSIPSQPVGVAKGNAERDSLEQHYEMMAGRGR